MIVRRLAGSRVTTLCGAVIAMVVVGVPVYAAPKPKAALKVGSACTKVGTQTTANNVTLTCTASGKKKVWATTSATTVAPAPTVGSPTPNAPTTTARTPTPASGPSPSPTPVSGSATPGPEGTWKVSAGSQAGYRVREIFVGGLAKVDAIGRTSAVTGTLTLTKASGQIVLQTFSLSVDMSKLESDESKRDRSMRTMGLETDRFPTASFVATGPTALPANADDGSPIKVSIPGTLTLHGVAKAVTIEVAAKLKGAEIETAGSLAIKLPDFKIEPPDIVDFVKADDDGVLEFRVLFQKS